MGESNEDASPNPLGVGPSPFRIPQGETEVFAAPGRNQTDTEEPRKAKCASCRPDVQVTTVQPYCYLYSRSGDPAALSYWVKPHGQ